MGRGGVLDLAARWASPDVRVSLDVVHRFTDPEYAAISLAMRTGERLGKRVGRTAEDHWQTLAQGEPAGKPHGERVGEVFDALWIRDQIRIYPSEAERTHALAGVAAASVLSGEQGVLVMARGSQC